MRRIPSTVALVLLLAAAGCSTADSIFPRTGSLKPQVLDLTIATQASTEPSNQFMKWTVTRVVADVAGVGPVNFLTAAECVQVQQLFSFNTAASCRFDLTGLALDAGSTGTATLRVEVKNLWVTRAERPLLVEGGDFDGDGVPDADDNCVYVSNPEQENENAEDEEDAPVGDACTNANGAKDSDDDGIADVTDNCIYVANPTQTRSLTDGFVDTVGEACAEKIQVTLPGPTLVIQRADQAFTVNDGRTTFLNFDFRSKDWCPPDPNLDPEIVPSCTIQPDDVVLNVQ